MSGETFAYLGRQCRLKVEVRSGCEPSVALRQGWLVTTVPSGDASERAEHVRATLIDWYRRHAASRVPERTAIWAEKLGLALPRVLIREPRQRWGSSHPSGVIRINWRIIQAPMRLVDYVVAHELAHLVHEGHGREFWQLLGQVMPDYEARSAGLAALGVELTW